MIPKPYRPEKSFPRRSATAAGNSTEGRYGKTCAQSQSVPFGYFFGNHISGRQFPQPRTSYAPIHPFPNSASGKNRGASSGKTGVSEGGDNRVRHGHNRLFPPDRHSSAYGTNRRRPERSAIASADPLRSFSEGEQRMPSLFNRNHRTPRHPRRLRLPRRPATASEALSAALRNPAGTVSRLKAAPAATPRTPPRDRGGRTAARRFRGVRPPRYWPHGRR